MNLSILLNEVHYLID